MKRKLSFIVCMLMLAVGYFWSVSMWAAIALILFLVFMAFRLNYLYCTRLIKLYKCIGTADQKK